MSRFIDITGQQFGRLTAIRKVGIYKTGESKWLCVCSCGREVIYVLGGIRKAKSCGCLKRKHGMEGTPEYRCYQNAKHRCRNPRSQAYSDYGGRGIQFLFDSFEQFYAELGPRPPGMSLDRINNDGNYEPGNVRWATIAEQIQNRRPRGRLSEETRKRISVALKKRFALAAQGRLKSEVRLRASFPVQLPFIESIGLQTEQAWIAQ